MKIAGWALGAALVAVPLIAVAGHHGELQEETAAARAAAFAEADADRSGTLTAAEFVAFRDIVHREMAARMFGRLDADGDGQLSEEELESFPGHGGCGKKLRKPPGR
jgi:hypothetical protein